MTYIIRAPKHFLEGRESSLKKIIITQSDFGREDIHSRVDSVIASLDEMVNGCSWWNNGPPKMSDILILRI